VRARDAYDVTVRRAGRGRVGLPSILADPDRVDQVEVVDLVEGETLLLWDCTPTEASKLVRALRLDLGALDPDAFRARWSAVVDPGQLPEL
jgi:hypothetical protein